MSYKQTSVAFQGYIPTTVNNVTGAGATPTLTGLTKVFDLANNFNFTSGTFTAPVGGIYHFDATLTMSSLTAPMNRGSCSLILSSGIIILGQILNIGTVRDDLNEYTLILSASTFLASSVTATIQYQITGGISDSASLEGAMGSFITNFSGFLVR